MFAEGVDAVAAGAEAAAEISRAPFAETGVTPFETAAECGALVVAGAVLLLSVVADACEASALN